MLVRPTTAEELYVLPDDGRRRELVRGEVRSVSPAGAEHGSVAMRLGARLAPFVLDRDLGEVYAAETGFLLSRGPDTVRAPDLAFVRRERVPRAPIGSWFPGAPDLAVEVVSPGDSFADVEEKAFDWIEHGAVLVWIVEPRSRTVVAVRGRRDLAVATVGDELRADDLLPGFRCPVRALFRAAE